MPELLRLWTHRWPRMLAGALLPSCCALCGSLCKAPGGAALCQACHDHYLGTRRARCASCANPLDEEVALCGACLAAQPAFDASVVACDYAAPLDQLVLQLKFGARLALAPWFAQMLRDAVLAQPGFQLPELLCPVPLGPRRLAERGFNQALEIARPLAAALGVALHPRLALRTLETRAQSGVAPGERASNMRDAFAVAAQAGEQVAGRHVGIVDDVMTSGHTLNALATELKRAGAARVSNLVFARTPPR
jgi:ComF family protein